MVEDEALMERALRVGRVARNIMVVANKGMERCCRSPSESLKLRSGLKRSTGAPEIASANGHLSPQLPVARWPYNRLLSSRRQLLI